jgi:hypothetical protein
LLCVQGSKDFFIRAKRVEKVPATVVEMSCLRSSQYENRSSGRFSIVAAPRSKPTTWLARQGSKDFQCLRKLLFKQT